MPVGYKLRLADGQEWLILSIDATKTFVDKFASILEIKPANLAESSDLPKLIFISEGLDKSEGNKLAQIIDPEIRLNFPSNGWRLNTIGNAKKILQFWYHNDVADVIYDIGSDDIRVPNISVMHHALYSIHRQTLYKGGLPIHSALIELDGIGVILPAKGGTGKSTCCSRVPPHWNALCDDEVLIVCNEHGRYMAHPLPTWSNYFLKDFSRTFDVQKSVPLKAIFFLEQSPIDEAIRISPGRSAILISEFSAPICSQAWRGSPDKDIPQIKEKLLNNVIRLAKTIPAFTLQFSLTGKFWEAIEKAIENV